MCSGRCAGAGGTWGTVRVPVRGGIACRPADARSAPRPADRPCRVETGFTDVVPRGLQPADTLTMDEDLHSVLHRVLETVEWG